MKESTEEKWVTVKYQGIEYPNYEVSSYGRAARVIKNEKVFVSTNTTRRRTIYLRNEGIKNVAPLARVILSSFTGVFFKKGLVADHINNNPFDDRLCNLQAITQSENVKKDNVWKKQESIDKVNLTPYTRSLLLKKNKFYKSISISLGRYRTEEELETAVNISKNIIKLYNINNNDKKVIAIADAIKEYRFNVGLPLMKRYGFQTTKKRKGGWLIKDINKYVHYNRVCFQQSFKKLS